MGSEEKDIQTDAKLVVEEEKVEPTQEKKSKKRVIRNAINFIITHWNKPPDGKYIPIKEIVFFCLGGMGIFAVTQMPVFVTLEAGVYIAAALKVSPNHIAIVAVINMIIGILLAPLRAAIIDNSKNSKYGKFRPFLLWLPIPILLSFLAIGWIPYLVSKTGNIMAMLALFIIIFNILNFFVALYTLAFTTLPQVISPSPEERTMIMSVGTFFYSLGPSILNFIFPILANVLFAVRATKVVGMNSNEIAVAGYNVIGTYKILLPILFIVFAGLGYILTFGVKERMVLSQNKVIRVKFKDGIKQTFENKYFWLYNISQASIAIRAMAIIALTTWAATYIINSVTALGLINTIIGTACVPGMLLAPWLIKKVGKKQIQIWSNLSSSVIALLVMLFAIKPAGAEGNFAVWQGWVMVAGAYFITLITSVQVVTIPALGAQMYDYQQYKTGNRIEGFLSQFGGIFASITGVLALVLKAVILDNNGVGNDYEILRRGDIFSKVLRGLLISSMVGGILCGLPYFFWDLNEKKHNQIMSVLKVRVKLEDNEIDKETAEKIEKEIMENSAEVFEKYFPKKED